FMSMTPTQRMPRTQANAAKVTTAVMTALAQVRRIAMSKDDSTVLPKTALSIVSCVNAWTVWTAWMISLARALVSATRSWLLRLSVLTQRPKSINGIITRTTAAMTSAVSLGLVMNIKVRPPTNMTEFRIATEIDEPTTVWIKVVSAVRRET